MNSELYTAASGLLVEQRRLETIANNLANLSTPGFRAQRLFSAAFRNAVADAPPHVQRANAAVALGGSWEHPGPGPLETTGRALDVALPPQLWLAAQGPNGPAFTRSGGLQLDAQGRLTDGAGHPLLDPQGKPIEGLGPQTRIGADGSLLDAAGAVTGRVRVVRAEPGALRRIGANLYVADGNAPEEVKQPALMPGQLEGSAADALGELVRLIEAQRAFEGYQKLISQTMNEVNRRAVNDLARAG